MRRYYCICLGVFIILGIFTISYRSEPTKFFGIADAKETIVNSESGVEIRRLYVVQGQTIGAGDTLVVLDQPQLLLRVNEIMHTLSEYKAQMKYQTVFSQAERRKYLAEQMERVNEITVQIRELEARYVMNKSLVKELRSLKSVASGENDSISPISTQIRGLRQLLETAKNPTQARIDFFSEKLTNGDDPVMAQVQRYTDELQLLQKQQQALVIRAPIDGMIGMVKFKEGEKVSPFDTILTLHAVAPSYVKGYIHEQVYTRVAIGDTVTVQSFANSNYAIGGTVVGVGARIVDYPERLRTRPEIPIWGCEVNIRIPGNNAFLLGEKVLISVLDNNSSGDPPYRNRTSLGGKKCTAELTYRKNHTAEANVFATRAGVPVP